MEEKDLVWLPKSVAVKVKQIETVEEADSMIQEYIKTKRQDFIRELENLDDDVLTFKGVCLRHRQELKKVYDEQANVLDDLWIDCGDMGSKIHKHAVAMAAELAPLTAEVKNLKASIEEVKKLIHEVSFYPAQPFVSTVESVARMDDKTKGLLRDLLDLKRVGVENE